MKLTRIFGGSGVGVGIIGVGVGIRGGNGSPGSQKAKMFLPDTGTPYEPEPLNTIGCPLYRFSISLISGKRLTDLFDRPELERALWVASGVGVGVADALLFDPEEKIDGPNA